jgi:hypothetical protein
MQSARRDVKKVRHVVNGQAQTGIGRFEPLRKLGAVFRVSGGVDPPSLDIPRCILCKVKSKKEGDLFSAQILHIELPVSPMRGNTCRRCPEIGLPRPTIGVPVRRPILSIYTLDDQGPS